jgi:flagellar assembly protein FliH
MKRWSEKIEFSLCPRDVRLASPRLTSEQEQQVVERERASYETGKADGERALREQLVQQRTELQILQQGVLASIQKAIPALLRESEGMLVNLAFEVARKIVGELPISVSMIETAIQEGLSRVEHHCAIDIALNPEDLALLERTDSPLLSGKLSESRIKISPSTEVSRGGCVVRTDFGTIDARREVKLAAIQASLEAGI